MRKHNFTKMLGVLALVAWMFLPVIAGAALTDFEIQFDPATDEITLTWNGGDADVYLLDQEYECSFSGATDIAEVSSPWVDTGASLQQRRFYRIARPDAPVTYSRTLGKADLNLRTGYNLVALPFVTSTYPYASQLVDDIEAQGGVVYELAKWDYNSGSWLVHDPTWPLVDFEIWPGDGMLIYMGNDTVWTVAGKVLRWDSLDMDIVYGYTQIGIPTFHYEWASEVAQSINNQGGGALEIAYWDSNSGIWLTHDVSWPVFDYEITPEMSLFVKASADSIWEMTMETGCEGAAPSPDGGTGGGHVAGSITVKVIDEETGAPISSAFVMVGDEPQAGDWNWGTTGGDGEITLSQADLEGPINVTAGDATHSWLTLFAADARDIVMPLKARDRTVPQSTVQGDVSGFDVVNNDGDYDVGFILEMLDFEQILSFNFDALMAPDVERCIQVGRISPTYECMDMPGNIYAPEQNEIILLITIYLRMFPYYQPLETDANHRLFAFAGRIEKQVLRDMFLTGETDIAQIASNTVPREVGVTDEFLVPGAMTKDFALTNTVSPTMPAHIDNFPADSEVYMLSIADLDDLQGLGQLILNGFVYTDGGGGAETHTVATINPGGSIPSYGTLGGAVAMGKDGTAVSGAITAQIDRDLAGRSSDAYMTTPFDFLTGLSQAGRTFNFSDPYNNWSPYPDLIRGNIYINTSGGDREYFWEYKAPGRETSITLPVLPASVSSPFRNPVSGESIRFDVSVSALTFGPWTYFDFSDYDFDDYKERTTHMSFRELTITNPY